MQDEIENELINYMYICIPMVAFPEWENYVITLNRKKAIELLKGKKYRVEIFKRNLNGFFIPSYDCLYIDKFLNSSND
jgi:hypothetical protein